MSLAYPHERLQLPEGLRRQLHDFRRRVWIIKMVEATCAAAFAVVAAYLLMFLLDRAFDTPSWLRAVLFVAAFVGCLRIPAAVYRWVWRNRRLEQLAMLLDPEAPGGRRPAPGDHRAGAQRLRAGPVAGALRGGGPRGGQGRAEPRLQRRRARPAAPDVGVRRGGADHRGGGAGRRVPGGGQQRLGAAALALGQRAAIHVRRARGPALEPGGRARRAVHGHGPAGRGRPSGTRRKARPSSRASPRWPPGSRTAAMSSSMPSQLEPGWLTIKVGDASRRIRIEPTLRPELTSLVASVKLPDYLGRRGALRKDVRGGAITLVQGSRAAFAATASRELALGEGRRQAAQALGRHDRHAGDPGQGHPQDGVPLAGHLRPGGQGAVHPGDHRPRRRGPQPRLRGPAAAEGRARLRAAHLQDPRPG